MRLVHTEEVRPGVWVQAYLEGDADWALRAFEVGPKRKEVPATVTVEACRGVLRTAQRQERERQADELRGGRV